MCQLSPVPGHVLLVVLDPDVAVDLAVPVDPALGALDHAALLKTKRNLQLGSESRLELGEKSSQSLFMSKVLVKMCVFCCIDCFSNFTC